MYVCHTFITWRYIYVCVPYDHNLEIYIYMYVCHTFITWRYIYVRVPYVHNPEIYICTCAIRS